MRELAINLTEDDAPAGGCGIITWSDAHKAYLLSKPQMDNDPGAVAIIDPIPRNSSGFVGTAGIQRCRVWQPIVGFFIGSKKETTEPKSVWEWQQSEDGTMLIEGFENGPMVRASQCLRTSSINWITGTAYVDPLYPDTNFPNQIYSQTQWTGTYPGTPSRLTLLKLATPIKLADNDGRWEQPQSLVLMFPARWAAYHTNISRTPGWQDNELQCGHSATVRVYPVFEDFFPTPLPGHAGVTWNTQPTNLGTTPFGPANEYSATAKGTPPSDPHDPISGYGDIPLIGQQLRPIPNTPPNWIYGFQIRLEYTRALNIKTADSGWPAHIDLFWSSYNDGTAPGLKGFLVKSGRW